MSAEDAQHAEKVLELYDLIEAGDVPTRAAERVRFAAALRWALNNLGDYATLLAEDRPVVIWRCSFCGSKAPKDEDQARAHMLACEKHPLAAVTKERDRMRAALEAEERAVELVNTSDDTEATMAATMKADRLRREALGLQASRMHAALKEWASSCADCEGTGTKIVSGEPCEEPCLSTRKLLER